MDLRRIKWRRLFRAIHRDLGYIAVALILAYGLSGLAVNHIEDWNPNYSYSTRDVDVGPLPTDSLAAAEAHVVTALGIARADVRGHFHENPRELRVFLDGGQEVRVEFATGRGTYKGLAKRAVFFEVNAMHLNNLKGIWTYVADAFAIALIILALTGLTMMKGDRGLLGRGKWFVAGGLAIPIAFVVYLYT
ncbi:MAG: PepSY-associated TM helix domain-containing protein [Deltaproteobacteria bacterium]|nr:PepSY-associated TM helix domain-containing protein [Deltaproteobacteria bacterium]